jgi:hypothetical protein
MESGNPDAIERDVDDTPFKPPSRHSGGGRSQLMHSTCTASLPPKSASRTSQLTSVTYDSVVTYLNSHPASLDAYVKDHVKKATITR